MKEAYPQGAQKTSDTDSAATSPSGGGEGRGENKTIASGEASQKRTLENRRTQATATASAARCGAKMNVGKGNPERLPPCQRGGWHGQKRVREKAHHKKYNAELQLRSHISRNHRTTVCPDSEQVHSGPSSDSKQTTRGT